MKHTLLCVDDEPDNVDALERLFRRTFKVLKAHSGNEALDLLKQEDAKNQPVSIIISDQRMPHMSGVQFLSQSREIAPDAIRILLTGYTDIESVIEAVNTGEVYRYMTKPWDPVDLVNTVQKAVEKLELQTELIVKNKSLNKALEELKILDEAKSHFMILINHELKTPLTVMTSFLDLLKESELDADQKKYVSRVESGCSRLTNLIQDSLELMSAEMQQMPVEIVKVDLVEILNKAWKKHSTAADAKKLEFLVNEKSVPYKSDRVILENVFSRLIDNAVKFSDEGTQVLAEFHVHKDHLEFTLQNRGPVPRAEVIEKILKPFTLDENIMHHSRGTGLGLSISQAQLKRLGLSLDIEILRNHFVVKIEFKT